MNRFPGTNVPFCQTLVLALTISYLIVLLLYKLKFDKLSSFKDILISNIYFQYFPEKS